MLGRTRWITVSVMLLALGLSACADDDAPGAVDTEDASDSDVADQLAAEAEELGVELSDEELAEAEQMVTGDAEGSATVIVDGEQIEFTGTSCGRGSEWWFVEALSREWGDVQVRFDEDINEPGTFLWDEGEIRIYRDEGPTLSTPWSGPYTVSGDEHGARGSGIVVDNNADPDERDATAVEVELEITCAG